MRLLLGLIFIFAGSTAHAGFMSEADIALTNAGTPGATWYKRRALCELREAAPCFQVDNREILKRRSIQSVRQGNWEAASSLEPCADPTDCASKQVAKVCPGPEYSSFHGDIDSDGDLEVWCTRRALVKRLLPDSALQAADDQRKSDLTARQAAIDQINTQVLQCARADLGSITPAQVAQCMKRIAKKLAHLQLQLNEL